MEKIYSKNLRNARSVGVDKDYLLNGDLTDRTQLTDDAVIALIKEFCNASDLVGVKPIDAWKLFCEFIDDRGLSFVVKERFTKLIRKAFPELKRKRVRINKYDLIWVYNIGGSAGR
jgi:hypothetical protein